MEALEAQGNCKTHDGVRRQAGPGELGKVRGVVLAGVHAWGSCVLEEALCRPLLPVALRPLISYPLQWLQTAGVASASVCGNSDTVIMRRHLGHGAALGISIEYYEDIMPRGPAGCARDAAIDTDADTIVVVDGTLVPSFDLKALLEKHARTGAAVTLVVARTSPEDAESEVFEPAGVFVFARRAFEAILPKGYQDIKETLIPALYRAGETISTFVIDAADALRVTDAASYLGVNMWTLQHASASDSPGAGYVRSGDAWVHSTATVDASAKLVGPVLVGPRSTIAEGALVVGPTTVGEGCQIGPRAVITRSALWNRVEVGAEAVLDQCILADGAHVEAEAAARQTAYVPDRRGDRKLHNWQDGTPNTRARQGARKSATLTAR
jgi:mannose-1-phosphate guanylyltransferase